jgi:hypothetical protein
VHTQIDGAIFRVQLRELVREAGGVPLMLVLIRRPDVGRTPECWQQNSLHLYFGGCQRHRTPSITPTLIGTDVYNTIMLYNYGLQVIALRHTTISTRVST